MTDTSKPNAGDSDRSGSDAPRSTTPQPSQKPADPARTSGYDGTRPLPEDRRLLGDFVKKAFATGINTMLNTEEGVRAVVGAVAQKDIIGSAVSGVDATRKEAAAIVGREIGSFLETLNLSEEITKILTSVSFEIRTEVRFVPNEEGKLRAKLTGGAKPKIKMGKGAEEAAENAEDPRRSGGHAAEDPEIPAARTAARRAVRGIVERFAEATAATARAAAEVAADATADVINEARRAADHSDGKRRHDHDDDDE